MFGRNKDTNTLNRKNRSRHLEKLQNSLKIKFKNKSLLNRSLTHRSYINESEGTFQDNERLEYLGDSVLGLVVNEYLFKHYEEYPEGNLAKIKSAVVSEETLASVARKINLGNFLLMGKGEELSGGRVRASLLANALEALIGALYLDAGLKISRKFILSLLKNDIERIDNLTYTRDPKTTLQEYVQKRFKNRPIYDLKEEKGPDHKKEFTIELIINEKSVAIGKGTSKRKAEMDAARSVLQRINDGDLTF